MIRTLPIWIAAGLTLAAGIVHGNWTDRWAPPAETQRASDRLTTIPSTLGDWDGQDLETKTTQGIAGALQRRYTHRLTGATVVLALVCGRPGPVSIHTPESCYAAAGYEFGTRSPVDIAGKSQFWTADAVRVKAADETRIRLFWAWNAGIGWTAPEDARMTFARTPVLHKLYVLRELNSLSETLKDDPGLLFLQTLIPALDDKLFAAND